MSIVKRTGEWSEQGSSKLAIRQCKLFGIFVMKMSKISGDFLVEEGQYVGDGGAYILQPIEWDNE